MISLNRSSVKNALKNVSDATVIMDTIFNIEQEVKIKIEASNEVDIGEITGNNINMKIIQTADGKVISFLSQMFRGVSKSDLSNSQKGDAANAIASGAGGLLVGMDTKNSSTNIENLIKQYEKKKIDISQFIREVMELDMRNAYRVGKIDGDSIKLTVNQLSNGTTTNTQTQNSSQSNTSSMGTDQSNKQKNKLKMSAGQVMAMVIAMVLIVVIVIIAIKAAKKSPHAQAASAAQGRL